MLLLGAEPTLGLSHLKRRPCRVVRRRHQGVDKSVDFGLFAGDRLLLGRLVLYLVLVLAGLVAFVDALLAHAVAHHQGRRVDDLRWHPGQRMSPRIGLKITRSDWAIGRNITPILAFIR